MILIVFIALFVMIVLYRWVILIKCRNLVKRISSFIKDYSLVSDSNIDKNIRNSIFIMKIIKINKAFEEGVPINDDYEDIFSVTDLINTSKRNNAVVLKYFPSIFLGLGILGTFTGLTFGIRGIELAGGAKVMEEGISVLLNQAGTAFWTSLIGLFLSILTTVVNIHYFYKLKIARSLIFDQLKESPKVGVFDEETEQVLSRYEVDAFYLKKIQSLELKVDGMAESISEKINEKMEDYQDSILNAFQGNAGQAAFEGAQKAKDTYGTVVDQLVTAGEKMKAIVDDLGNELSYNIDQFKSLVEKVTDVVSSFDDQINSMGGTISELNTLESSLASTRTSFQDTAENLDKVSTSLSTATETSANSTSELTEVWGTVKDDVAIVLSDFKIIEEAMGNVSNNVSHVFSTSSEELKKFQEIIGNQTIKQLKEYKNSINDFAGRLSTAAEELGNQMSLHPFNKSADEMVQVSKELENTIKLSSSHLSEIMNVFSNISESQLLLDKKEDLKV